MRTFVPALLEVAIVHIWIAWARGRSVCQPMARDAQGFFDPAGNDWAVVLWACVGELGIWESITAMTNELSLCKVLVNVDGDVDSVTLAGYGALNEALDPLFVGRAQKGGHLRHWKKHRAQATKEAAAQVEVSALADIPLPFASEDAPSKDEERRTLELVFGVAMALQVEIAEPSRQELSSGLHLLRTMSEAVIEDTLTLIAAHRSRPDISGRPVVEVLEGFASLHQILAGIPA